MTDTHGGGERGAVHDRWDVGAALVLARLDGLTIEPKGRGVAC